MHSHRERKLHTWFLIIAILMAARALFAYRTLDQQKQRGNQVVHTHEVLDQIETLSNHLTDAETGQRGYLLTGQTIYLRPYSMALQHIDRDVAHLQQLTLG